MIKNNRRMIRGKYVSWWVDMIVEVVGGATIFILCVLGVFYILTKIAEAV